MSRHLVTRGDGDEDWRMIDPTHLRELKAELVASGETDPYLDEELELLTGQEPSS